MDKEKAGAASGTIDASNGIGSGRSPTGPEAQFRYFSLPRLAAGTVINDRYRLEKPIGKGGFGMVFAGFDLTLKTPVALKFFDPASLQDEKKFLRVQREINLSRRISDPRIIKIFSLENWAGIWFMVMELIQSDTMSDLLKAKERFTWEEFRPIFLDILQGVGSLHGQGIIHRDLKPSNIMVDTEGRIKILDFGLAKEIGDLEKTSSIGEIVGSPFYLSPEQIRGLELGVESDIYQLGILLYHSLTGAFPFPDTTTMSMVLMHLNHPPARIEAQGIKVPAVVEFAIAKALAKRRQNRFRSTVEMAERLRKDSVPLLPSLARLFPMALRRAAALATILLHHLCCLYPDPGSRAVHSLETGRTSVQAKNRFGRTLWQKDFAPFAVHLAYLIPEIGLDDSLIQQNPIQHVKDFSLNNLQNQPSPLAVVFLSHPDKGIFAGDCSVNSGRIDNQLAILDPGENRSDKNLMAKYSI